MPHFGSDTESDGLFVDARLRSETDGSCAGIFVLKHESRKIAYFWVVQKFKVLVFRSDWFGLLLAAA